MSERCHECGYDVKSLHARGISTCSECGADMTEEAQCRDRRNRCRVLVIIGAFTLAVMAVASGVGIAGADRIKEPTGGPAALVAGAGLLFAGVWALFGWPLLILCSRFGGVRIRLSEAAIGWVIVTPLCCAAYVGTCWLVGAMGWRF